MLKIEKNKVFTIKWNTLKMSKEKLNKVSGLYFFHVNKELMYIGKSENLWDRFGNGYLKEESKVHKNNSLLTLIKSKPEDLIVSFAPMNIGDLKEQETYCIQSYIPKCNVAENPKYQVRSIQRVIGRIVNESNSEWSYNNMRKHLLAKWNNRVSLDMINEALENRTNNLSRYCRAKLKQEILMPKANSLGLSL